MKLPARVVRAPDPPERRGARHPAREEELVPDRDELPDQRDVLPVTKTVIASWIAVTQPGRGARQTACPERCVGSRHRQLARNSAATASGRPAISRTTEGTKPRTAK